MPHEQNNSENGAQNDQNDNNNDRNDDSCRYSLGCFANTIPFRIDFARRRHFDCDGLWAGGFRKCATLAHRMSYISSFE